MATLVLGSPPPELEALLERRRMAGVDRLDEAWEGVRHVVPGDETLQKLPFYAAHGVDEVLLVDPSTRTVTWLGLFEGAYRPVGHSGLIGLGPVELAEQLGWR